MERCHVIDKTRVDEVVRISASFCAMLSRPVKAAGNRAYGLQEGRYAQLIE